MSSPTAVPASSRGAELPVERHRAPVVAVFLAAATVYLLSPVRQISDSYGALLTAHALATRATLDLSPHLDGPGIAGAAKTALAAYPTRDGLPYQMRRHAGKVLYDFPLGGPLLAAPWVGAAHTLGAGVVDPSGHYDGRRDALHQRLLAALASALFVACAAVACVGWLQRNAALWTAAVLALATPLWSTASRGWWSHTAALAALAGALPLLADRARGGRPGGLRLGALLAASYLCRPTLAIDLALVGAWLGLSDRRAAGRYALGALPVLGGFAALSLATWGSWLPPYYVAERLAPPRLEALAGALVSPSRGLLVFEPALAVALIYGARRWRDLAARPLFVLGAAGLALHALAVGGFAHWWGGHGYGPRLFTETVFLQALVALAVAATLVARGAADARWRRVFVAAAVLGFALHAPGALSNQSNRWNWSPAPIDERQERLWDWSDPQALAWANRGPRRHATIVPPAAAAPAEAPAAERPERGRRRHAQRQRPVGGEGARRQ